MKNKKKAAVLLSPGIDSPVAGFLMKKKGLENIYLHLNTAKNDIEIVKNLKNKIDSKAKLVIIDFNKTLADISNKANRRYTCILCKRAMYREAEKLAKKESADFIVTGENLGQVASQTLENLAVLDRAASIPVLRPLLCLDKQEIVDIAKQIGTYEISGQAKSKCPFVPRNPATKAKISVVENEEKRVELL